MQAFKFMRSLAKPVSIIMSAWMALYPIGQAYGQPTAGEVLSTDGVLQVDPLLVQQWNEYIKSPNADIRAINNDAGALALDIPAALLDKTVYRMNGSMAQVFGRYDSVAAEGVIDVVWLDRHVSDRIIFKMDRVGGRSGNANFGAEWGKVFSGKADGYHCDNRFLVTGKDASTQMETCANPLQYRTFTTDENGRAILTNLSFDAFIALMGMTQAKFRAAEAWAAVDNTMYGDVKRRVDQWTSTSDCGWFCKRTTQHLTMQQTGVSWYVSTAGMASAPDAITGGFCVDPSDAADGTCDGAKVVGQTAFIKAAPDAQLPQDVVMAYYMQKSQEGMTGFGFALAVFGVVALAVVTGGAAMGMGLTQTSAAVSAATNMSIATLSASVAGSYAALSTIASDMRGIDQVQNGLFGNLSDGQLASSFGTGVGAEMHQAIRNKFIYADPLFTEARNGGMPNHVYGNAGGGDWNTQNNALMSKFALGNNGGTTCNRAGVRAGTCVSPGRMIRPDDFFVQTLAAPDVKAHAQGKVYNRTIDPMNTKYSDDATINALLQNSRAEFKKQMQELLDKR